MQYTSYNNIKVSKGAKIRNRYNQEPNSSKCVTSISFSNASMLDPVRIQVKLDKYQILRNPNFMSKMLSIVLISVFLE